MELTPMSWFKKKAAAIEAPVVAQRDVPTISQIDRWSVVTGTGGSVLHCLGLH